MSWTSIPVAVDGVLVMGRYHAPKDGGRRHRWRTVEIVKDGAEKAIEKLYGFYHPPYNPCSSYSPWQGKVVHTSTRSDGDFRLLGDVLMLLCWIQDTALKDNCGKSI